MANKKQVGQEMSEPAMRRRYPGSKVMTDIQLDLDNTLRLPSRVLSLNHQTGTLPYGHILELYGEENVGKTLLAMDYAYCAQALNGMVLWYDAEGTFSPHWAKENGLVLPKIELYSNKEIETLSDWAADMVIHYRRKLVHNEPILLVVDSIAALDTIERLTTAMTDKKAEMGIRAKAMDDMLRTRTGLFHKYGICVILINQVRAKIGASQFEDPETTPGGKALKFYASQRMGLYSGAMLKDENKIRYGRKVYARMKKTKTGVPRENTVQNVIFRSVNGLPVGYDKTFGLLEALIERKVLKRSRGTFTFKGEILAKSEEKMNALLRTDDDLRRRLLKRSKINTIGATKAQLEAIKTNLYPVNVKKAKADSDDGE